MYNTFRILTLFTTLSSATLLAYPHRDVEGAKNISFSEEAASPNPYVTDGLVAMWDAEWNTDFGVHDPYASVWVDLVGDNDMVLNPASSWAGNCLVNAPNTKGAVAQRWAEGAVTMEVVMRITDYYLFDNPVFIVYNVLVEGRSCRGIGKRYERLTNCVQEWYLNFDFKRTDIFQASFYAPQLFDMPSYIDTISMDQSILTYKTHTIDEDAVYVNAGQCEVEFYTIRLYNRELTETERLFNYALDKQRFNLP